MTFRNNEYVKDFNLEYLGYLVFEFINWIRLKKNTFFFRFLLSYRNRGVESQILLGDVV